VQYQHLLDALRPLLRQFAAYPRSVNQVGAGLLGSADPTWRALVPRPRREPHPAAHAPFLQSNAHVLPIMLATKLLPEMEAEEQRLLQQLEREDAAARRQRWVDHLLPPEVLERQPRWLV
jgi:hypothetical protein